MTLHEAVERLWKLSKAPRHASILPLVDELLVPFRVANRTETEDVKEKIEMVRKDFEKLAQGLRGTMPYERVQRNLRSSITKLKWSIGPDGESLQRLQ